MAKRKKRGTPGEGYCSFDPKRNRWRVTVRHAGSPSKTKYFVAEVEARHYHEAQKLIIRSGVAPKVPPTLLAATAEYNTRHQRGAAAGTIVQYDYRAFKVLEQLGNIPVTSITPTAVAGMAAHLATTLAASTVDGIVTYLYSVCEDLIALGELTTNPVRAYRRIVPPRSRGGKPARKAVVLDSAHARAVIAALSDTVFDRYITWLICIPLRVSELRGLRWANVDSASLTIDIVEQRRHADKWTAVKLKTEGSQRKLPITESLLRLAGPRRAGTELVFTNTESNPIDDKPLRLHLDAALEACKLPYTRMHDLRHTCASNILRLGCPIDYERALLGHAPRDITEAYARPDAEVLRPYVDKWVAIALGESRAGLRQIGA